MAILETLPPTSPSAGQRGASSRYQAFRQLAWFTAIGVGMTVAYLGLYYLLAGTLGAQLANIVAWVVTAIADTSANRRVTFGISGRSGVARSQIEGLMVFAFGLVLTSGSLVMLGLFTASRSTVVDLGVLAGANVAAGLLRFVLLRVWVFNPSRVTGPTVQSATA